MIKTIKILTIVQICLFLTITLVRFGLTTLSSLNYKAFAFYQTYNHNLTRSNQSLQLKLNKQKNLVSLTAWASQRGFTEINSISYLNTSLSIAQNTSLTPSRLQ
ncbi:MAG: hypothetical protein GXP43_02460 [bacterium]|nr:hypothetical protein [bacterium]